MIEINNLNFGYKEKVIFENLNLNIRKNNFITILGENSSGKSTLARLIKDKYNGITINDNNICYISSNPDNHIIGKDVKSQLLYYLKKESISLSERKKMVDDVIKDFSFENIVNCDPFELSNELKQMIVLLSYFICDYRVIIIDDAMGYLSSKNKKKIIKYLKQKKRTIINITNNSDECLYGEYTGIINNKSITIKKNKEIFKNEKIFLDNNIRIPFMVELSQKLKCYELIDDIILELNEMVDIIWN